VPSWLIDVVDRLLEKDPENRPQSAGEVAALLADQLARIQQPQDARATPKLQPGSGAAAPSARHSVQRPGIPLGARLLIWLGVAALLVPLLIGLVGTAIGAGGDALQAAVIAAMVCFPAGLVLVAAALMDRSFFAGSRFAYALFILICVILGPVGILLYLVFRDQPLSGIDTNLRPFGLCRPGDGGGASTTPGTVDARPGPSSAPRSGPVMAFSMALFVVASLILGQAIEQWSDVSEQIGLHLLVVALLLGGLAVSCLQTTRTKLSIWYWLTLPLASLPLMFVGAQGPSREWKQTLANEVDLVAVVAGGISLTTGLLIVVLWWVRRSLAESRPSSTQPTPTSRSSTSPWRVLGWMLVIGLVFIPLSIVAMLVVPYLAQSTPRPTEGPSAAEQQMTLHPNEIILPETTDIAEPAVETESPITSGLGLDIQSDE